MNEDASHDKPDTELHQQQLRSMPKPTKPDQCARDGKTECADITCQYYGRGCPMSGNKPPETGAPTKGS